MADAHAYLRNISVAHMSASEIWRSCIHIKQFDPEGHNHSDLCVHFLHTYINNGKNTTEKTLREMDSSNFKG